MLALVAIAATASAQNSIGGHEYVDLGLPSGTLWATCNVGAEKPEDYGLYFAWGETKGYTGDTSDGRLFNWDNYKWGKKDALTKYTGSDGKAELYDADDAATANWGGKWRMPTLNEIYELLDNTTHKWVTQNGVNGRLFTAANGNSIFLPASGYRSGRYLVEVGSVGYYWSSLLYESRPAYAFFLYFLSDNADRDYGNRCYGKSVRPVIGQDDISTGIEINATNFPDANFRSYVKSNIDTNKDGYLSDAEIAAVTSMKVIDKSIENLKGIEYFTALTSLHCHKNKLTSLNLSNNTKLSYLECGTNQLTSLDVSKNTELQTIWCNNNKLTALDLSKNTKLTSLYCFGNQIKDDKMLALVNSLPTVSGGKGKLHVIDTKNSDEQNVITKSQVAIAKGKNWTVYDRNGTSPVEYAGSDDPTPAGIAINETNFPDEKFRNWVLAQSYGKDGILTDAEIAAVTSISVVERSIKNLKGIEFFTALQTLYCQKNQLTSLDLSKNTNLQTIWCNNNKLTALDLSKNTKLTALYCFGNQIKGDKMQVLVNSLPTVTSGKGKLHVIDTKNSDEQNDITKAQVAIAKSKNWTVYDRNGTSPVEYEGSDSTTSIETNHRETITNNDWYSIDGKKLSGEPKAKGIYIHKGKKVKR